MRDFKGMKRQRGRNRGGGGGGGSSGGGKQQPQNANRAFDSNGPEGAKVRGNAQHVFEKYQQLARDASSAGDRVLAENYLQHAEHYFRLLRAMQPQRPASEILGRDHFSSGFDIDFEDEGIQAQAEAADEAAAARGPTPEVEPQAEGEGGERWQERPRDDRQRDDRQRDDRPRTERNDRYENRDSNNGAGRRDRWQRDDRPRDDRPREDRPRDDRPRDERPRDDRPRDERPREDRGPREDRAPREERAPREDRQRDDRPRSERNDRDDRRGGYERNRDDRDPLAVVEPQAQPLPVAAEERPSPVLRDSEGGESHAPAFLQASTAPRPAADGEEPARKPRRRRTPRSEGAPPASETEEA
jgi:hypothetical protein